jgi:hypothetical protein
MGFDNLDRKRQQGENSSARASARTGSSDGENQTRAQFLIPPQMKEDFRSACESDGITMTQAWTMFMEWYIETWKNGDRPHYQLMKMREEALEENA